MGCTLKNRPAQFESTTHVHLSLSLSLSFVVSEYQLTDNRGKQNKNKENKTKCKMIKQFAKKASQAVQHFAAVVVVVVIAINMHVHVCSCFVCLSAWRGSAARAARTMVDAYLSRQSHGLRSQSPPRKKARTWLQLRLRLPLRLRLRRKVKAAVDYDSAACVAVAARGEESFELLTVNCCCSCFLFMFTLSSMFVCDFKNILYWAAISSYECFIK